jgi:hypothetical protein
VGIHTSQPGWKAWLDSVMLGVLVIVLALVGLVLSATLISLLARL